MRTFINNNIMASTCTYIGKNGLPSKLYNDLSKNYNKDTALATWLSVLNNFPNKRNVEPTLNEVINKGFLIELKEPIKNDNKLSYYVNQFNKLKKSFDSIGINVNLQIDFNSTVSGKVDIIKDIPTITINPNIIKDDTIFHEFGHLYVDLLGYNHPLIQKGIKELRNTKLWTTVESLYPELNEEALGKEVLTFAIGEEAKNLEISPNKWKLWLNTLFREIAKLFNFDIFTAKLLAKQLVSNNLVKSLNGKFEINTRYQKDLSLVNNKFKTKSDLVEKALGVIKKKITTFYKNIKEEDREKDTNYIALKALEESLIEHADKKIEEGLIAFIQLSLAQTGKLEVRLDRLINPTAKDKAEGKDKVSPADLRLLMKYNSTFSLSEDIIDLTTTDKDLKDFLEKAGIYSDLLEVQRKYTKIKNNSTRLAITLMSQRLSKVNTSKVEAIRKKELEKEYNRLYKEERKAGRKKDRLTFSDSEKQQFKIERDLWINNQISYEKSELAFKAIERYKYLLQQTNQDIGFLDRKFSDGDAINDEIIQLTMELLDEADFNTMSETTLEYDKINKLFEEYSKIHTSGNQIKKYNDLIENEIKVIDGVLTVTGKKTKNLVSEYYSQFLIEKENAWKEYNKLVKEKGKLDPDTKLALLEAKAWSASNEVTMPDGRTIPKEHWRNPQYELLKNSEKATKNLYEYFIERIKKDDNNIPYWAKLSNEYEGIFWYRLPSIKKRGLERIYENGLVETIKDNVKNTLSKNKEDSTEFGGDTVAEAVSGTIQRTISVLTDEEGNEKHDIPINFRYDIPTEDQSFDLPSIFLLNFSMVKNYENKQKIQADLELTRDLIKTRKVVKTQTGFLTGALTKIDKLLDTGLTNSEPITTEGIDSNSYKALESIIEDRLYGIASKSGIRANKIASLLSSYTGNVLLVGNYLSSGANLVAGSVFNWMGKFGGEFYSEEDIAKATAKYVSDIPKIINDFGKIRYSSKTNLLMEKFNALSDWTAVAKKFADDSRFKQLFKTSSLHAMNALAEHSIQNVLMYAILTNTKVKNEKGEYLTKDGTTASFKEAMSLDEAYTIVNGQLVLDDRVHNTTKFLNATDQKGLEFRMSRLIRDMNAYLQGQYSNEKRSEIQRFWYGKLIMLLRKWLPRGLKYRWSGINTVGVIEEQLTADDIFYSRALDKITEGYYTTSIRFLYNIFLDLKALKANLILDTALQSRNALIKDRWEGLTDQEQGNIIKTVKEAVSIIVLITVANMLKGLGDDDDKNAKKYYLAAFYAIRLQKEMLTYINPAELTKTLRSPSASLIMVDRILHALNQLISNPTEVYATGRRKGMLKIGKDLEDLFPIFKHIDRDIEEALSFLMSRRVR